MIGLVAPPSSRLLRELEERKVEQDEEVMVVRVISRDITRGRRRSPEFCPFALALYRAGVSEVSVRNTSVWLRGAVWRLPWAARWRIVWFDQTGRMRPGVYVLRRR